MNNRVSIKYPIQAKFVFTMLWVAGIMLLILWRNPFRDRFDQFMGGFEIIWVAFCAFMLLAVCIRGTRRPKALMLEKGRLILEGEEINAMKIQEIVLDRNIYGIKLNGRRMVPLRLCFILDKNQPAGEYELLDWAKQNHIAVTRRIFMKWL